MIFDRLVLHYSHLYIPRRHLTNLLLGHRVPVLGGLHHLATVEAPEPEAVVEVVAASVDDPSRLVGVGDSCRLHNYVLGISPCHAWAGRRRENVSDFLGL